MYFNEEKRGETSRGRRGIGENVRVLATLRRVTRDERGLGV